MNFIGRRDTPLLAGLTVAALVVFSRQVRALLDFARNVEQTSGVALIVPLVILIVVFFFHQHGKRQEARARVTSVEAENRDAQARAAELERLVIFGQALGRSLEIEAIRDVVLQHLEPLTGTREGRVIAQRDGHWQVLVDAGQPAVRDSSDAAQELANQIVSGVDTRSDGSPIPAGGLLWWPMTAGVDTVGFLGVPEAYGPALAGRSRVMATAATLLGISLRTAALFRQLKESSLKDGLTGCFNRTHALEVIEMEMRRARRSRLPLSLLMFDLDDFKSINDRRGHLCGDAVLAGVGQTLRTLLRGSDLKCRYGGEEFLVLLPDTPIEGARHVADTLRRGISDRPLVWRGEPLTVTASFGVAAASPSESDPSTLIGRADSALYMAKEQGRNRVCVSTEAVVR
jgi:diguanylate cyclase (GGDEF)-like protein